MSATHIKLTSQASSALIGRMERRWEEPSQSVGRAILPNSLAYS